MVRPPVREDHRVGGHLERGDAEFSLPDAKARQKTPRPTVHAIPPVHEGRRRHEPGALFKNVHAGQLAEPEPRAHFRPGVKSDLHHELVIIDIARSLDRLDHVGRPVHVEIFEHLVADPERAAAADTPAGLHDTVLKRGKGQDHFERRARRVARERGAVEQGVRRVGVEGSPEIGRRHAAEDAQVVVGLADHRDDAAVCRIDGHDRTRTVCQQRFRIGLQIGVECQEKILSVNGREVLPSVVEAADHLTVDVDGAELRALGSAQRALVLCLEPGGSDHVPLLISVPELLQAAPRRFPSCSRTGARPGRRSDRSASIRSGT